MKRPDYLLPGDTIGITAPARKISREELLPARTILESWGFKVKYAGNLFGEKNQFSGDDEQRAADFNDLLADKTVKAILCARGGYGSIRIADMLETATPKWIIGYSDITVFHQWSIRQGWESIHGTMPVNMAEAGEEVMLSNESLKRALTGEAETIRLESGELAREGNAEGILTGGNLSVIYSLMGSNLQPETQGKILFLEDLDEYLYHIDRMMICLDRAGMLKGLAALVIGGMSKMHDNTVPFGKTAEEIIASVVSKYDYPVYYGAGFGHQPLNKALVHGRKYRIEDNLLVPA